MERKTKNFDKTYKNLQLFEAYKVLESALYLLFNGTSDEIRRRLSLEDLQSEVDYFCSVIANNEQDTIDSIKESRSIGSYTIAHSLNVAAISVLIAKKIGYSFEEISEIGLSAVLHDIGKRFIGEDIIYKEGTLSEGERAWVKMHSRFGEIFLKHIYPDINEDIINGVLYHHERLDGTGYPEALSVRIPYIAKIIAVADVFEAYTAKRAYHKNRTIKDGLDFISGAQGLDKFIVNTLVSEFSSSNELICANF